MIKRLVITLIFILLVAMTLYLFHIIKYLNEFSNSLSNQNQEINKSLLESDKLISKKQNTFTFTFGGDMMFDRMIDYRFKGDDLIKSVENLGQQVFGDSDLSMINLEGPISAEPIETDIRADNLVFNFPPKTIDVLKWLNIKFVSLANNHTNNNGSSGLKNTRKVLEDSGISWVGSQNIFDESSIKQYVINNNPITIIAINQLETDPDICPYIEKEKNENRFVILFAHWGSEYQQTHSSGQQQLAYFWVNCGADLIIGSHPHVIQDAEIYNGKYIFYSLGNLLFDQTFSHETQIGIIVRGIVTNNIVSQIEILPTVSINLRPELMQGSEKNEIIGKFNNYFIK